MKKIDRRIKLNEEQKTEIRELYPTIENMAKIGRMFDVSRSTIRDIVKPNVKERNKINLAKKGTFGEVYPQHKMTVEKRKRYQNIINKINQKMIEENTFQILKQLGIGQTINIVKLKSGTVINNFEISQNDTDKKQLFQDNGSSIVLNYEDIKQIIFKSK